MTTTASSANGTTYWVGGGPPSLVLDVDTDVTLAAVTSVSASLVAPDGTAIPGAAATLAGEQITVTLPADAFTTGGFHSLNLILTAPTFTEYVEPVLLVVQAMDGWLTLEQARVLWPQAPDEDAVLFMLLESAKAACIAFAPVLPAGMIVPVSYRQAQFQQARASWLAMSATMDASVGDNDFAVTVFPLDWNVKQLLRPKGLPVMF